MPKAKQKPRGTDEGDEDVPLHGTINEKEAHWYTQNLEKIISNFASSIEDKEADAMKLAICNCKEAMVAMVPGMEEANPDTVLKAVKDQCGLTLCPRTEDRECLLEKMILEEDIPSVSDVIQGMEELDTLTEGDRTLLGELFDFLEIAHTELTTAYSILGRLSQRLRPHQLLAVLRASVFPMIQLNAVSGFFEPPIAGKKLTYPMTSMKG